MSKPPFIAGQKLLVLDAPPKLAMRCLSPGAYLTSVPSAEELKELNRRLPRGCAWRIVEDRIAFLADTSIKRLCFLVDAGVGKSTVLSQCAYARQHLDELTDLPRHRTGHLVIDLPFTDLPDSCREYLDAEEFTLATLLETELQEKLPGIDRDEINPWLKSLAHRGDLTLNIDALDQFEPTAGHEPRKCRKELRQFLRRYPNVRVVTSGRPSAISSNDSDKLFHPDPKEPQWTFAVICLFDDEQRAEFVGPERAPKLEQAQIAPGELNVPRMLEAVRRIPVDQLADVRTASDIYWRALMTTINPSDALPDSDTPQYQEKQQVLSVIDEKYRPNPSRQLFLFSIMAFQLLLDGNTEGVEGEEKVNGFLKRIWKRRKNVIKDWISEEFSDLDFERQMAVFMDLNKSSLEHAIVDGDIKRVKFQNRSFQNFFAALWCARYADNKDRQWLLEHRTICYAFPPKAKKHVVELYEFWKLFSEMPGPSSPPEMGPALFDESFCRTISVLFENGPLQNLRDRPTEMIWRCWPTLVQLADPQALDPGWTEADVTIATEKWQREAWTTPQPMEASGAWNRPHITAQDIMLRFLSEFPRIASGEAGDVCREVARNFHDAFLPVPPAEDEDLRTWFSNETDWGFVTSAHDDLLSLPGRFLLHAYPVTNEVFNLFDESHWERSKEDDTVSNDPKCPTTNVSWYDAGCLAIWLHARLPTELEWEYACRADPGGKKGPVDFWWSQAGESFEEARRRITEYAWTKESGKERLQPVGAAGHANPFGLSDMLGGVWEWTASYWHDESRQSAFGGSPTFARVLRGGSFLESANVTRCSERGRYAASSADRHVGVRFARAPFRTS